MYDTHEEATQKLGSCVVLFHNKPTYVLQGTGSRGKVSLRHVMVRDSKEMSNPITDDGWNFKDLGSRLGYTNLSVVPPETSSRPRFTESLYLSRAAVRASHGTQGLSHRNVRYKALRGSGMLGVESFLPDWDNIRSSACFCDTLEGLYPGFEALPELFSKDKTVISVAFDRDFAVRRQDVGPFYLEYKGRDVGYTEDFDSWRVADRFRYLQESLEDKKIPFKVRPT